MRNAPLCGESGGAIVPVRRSFPAVLDQSGLHLQQAFHVAAEDLCLVLRAERDALSPVGAGLILDERVIDREEDAVNADLLDAAQERRVGEEAAGGDPEMLAERVAEPCRPGAI